MIDELYIDGQRADLSGADIYLDYKSQLLADIKQLIASHSYSIKLPKTANNLRLIDCSHVPTTTSRFAYTKHKATLLRDGVCLLDNVDVVLLSVGNTIDISLLWNAFPKMQNIQNVNLNEMPYELDNTDDNTEYIVWYGTSADGKEPRSKDSRFPQMELGQLWRNNFRHPVLSLYEILQKISRYYDVSFNYPADARERLQSLVVPILKREVAAEFMKPFSLSVGIKPYGATGKGFVDVPLNEWQGSGKFYDYLQISTDTIKGWEKPVKSLPWGVKYTLKATAELRQVQFTDYRTLKAVAPEELYIRIDSRNIGYNKDGVGNYGDVETTYLTAYRTELSSGVYGKYVIDDKCELPVLYPESIFIVSIRIKKEDEWSDSFTFFTGSGTIHFEFIPEVEKVEPTYGNDVIPIPFLNYYYFLVPNLPKIKVTDFIKSVAQLFGWFIYEQNGQIIFKPYQVLTDNKSVAKDWSEYYLSSGETTLEYVINDQLTKRNAFAFANKTDYPETTAVIEINNEQLSNEESNFVESKFSAASNSSVGGIVSIPIYEYNYDWDGTKQSLYDKWKYTKDDKMYLLSRIRNGEYYTAQFTQTWGRIVADYWQTYVSMIEEGKLITCTMLLSPLELRTLDMSVPVYIKQLGSYFAVVEIKTKADNQAEVKLIKL